MKHLLLLSTLWLLLPGCCLAQQKGPFTGYWKNTDGSTLMAINLYIEPFSMEEETNTSEKCNGYIQVNYKTNIDVCLICGYKVTGNTAVIEYESSRDGNTYCTTLTYDPKLKQIKLKGRETVKKGEFGIDDCYVGMEETFNPALSPAEEREKLFD